MLLIEGFQPTRLQSDQSRPPFKTSLFDGKPIDHPGTDTVDTDELTYAVDRLIRDGGVKVLTTTGSFGEFHTLLWDEHKKLIEATVAAVKKRVPLFVGCTNLNPREAIRQAKFAQEVGADGLLLGVPFYYRRWTMRCSSITTSPRRCRRWA